MILIWPAYIQGWPYLRTVEFPDEPKTWWWTDAYVLLRGVGQKPDGYNIIKPKKEFAETALLDVRRTRTKWEHGNSKWTSVEEYVCALKNDFHGIDAKYHRLLEHWSKPVKWLVPVKGDNWCAPTLAVEVESQQVVAVIMPLGRTQKGPQ